MSLSLPDAITTYFSISNGADATHIADCFTQDACVFDEGETHRGRPAIQAWMPATVTGNFPGSPVQLDHAFQLAESQIQSLEIH